MVSYKSSETVVDSDSDEEIQETFQAPKGYKSLTHVPSEYLPSKDEEVWLIQMPHGIPLDKLHKLKGSQVKIVDTEDTPRDYRVKDISNEPGSSKFKLIFNDKLYTEKKINRILRVSESVRIPSIDFRKVAVPKPVVEQKQGLRTRHFATGYGPDKTSLDLEVPGKEAKKTEKKEKKEKKEKEEKEEKEEKKEDKSKSKKRKKDSEEHKKKKKAKKSEH